MARRKIALVFLLLFLLGLVLSPWASAPSPAVQAPSLSKGNSRVEPGAPAADKPQSVRLRVAAALNEEEFQYLQQQSAEQAFRFPDINVEFERVAPEAAYAAFRTTSRVGEAADVMLMENEWVEAFAASGFLKSADSAFVGEALSEQFDALSAPLKWNGYWWGVPRDFDPYVLVWSVPALHSLLGESASFPQDLAQWTVLAGKSRQNAGGVRWLSIDGRDPFALLTWVQSAAGQRTDTLWNEGANVWSGSPKGDALNLLEHERSGVSFGANAEQMRGWLLAGRTAAAVLPYSESIKLTAGLNGRAMSEIAIDRSAWKLPYLWPRGRSFVISSRTAAEDAARRWIADMTDAAIQRQNERQTGKLPVYRSLYVNGGETALSPASTSSFPNQPPAAAATGPELPARLSRLGALWRDLSSGRLSMETWIRRWPETSADFQLND